MKYSFVNKIEKVFFILLFISLVFWIWYTTIDGYNPLLFYFIIWILWAGYLVYKKHNIIQQKIDNWKIKSLYKFAILWYLMVLLEEIVAWVANHLSEPFSIGVIIARVFQFQFFNLFAFTGLIFGTYLALKKFHYTKTEIFYVAWAWWIFSESVLTIIWSNPIAFILLISPMVYTYGLIMYPAISSLSFDDQVIKYNPPKIFKYIFTYIIIFVLSVLPIFIMSLLRTYYPFLFPPSNFIAL